MAPRVVAVVPAAGAGLRLNAAGMQPATRLPKALRSLGGRSLLEWSVTALSDVVDQIVVAVPDAYVGSVAAQLVDRGCPTDVVAGGPTRQESVRRALVAADEALDLVVVHDAARPLVPCEVIVRVIEALLGGAPAVVPVISVSDSLRRTDDGVHSVPIDRRPVRAVQTPQGFRRDLLIAAHREATGSEAADDSMLVEALGVPVTLVEGSELAFKITRPIDYLIAEALVASSGRRGR